MASTIKKTSSVQFYLYLVIGVLLVAMIPPIFALGLDYLEVTAWKDTTSNSMVGNAIALFAAAIILRRFERFPQKNTLAFILPISLSIFAILLAVLLALRLNYSIKIIAIGLLLTLVLLGFQHLP